MSAELLQRAAKVLREHVENASPGPWTVVDPNEGSGHGPLWMVVNDEFLNPAGDDGPSAELELRTGVKADAELVALMHPPAALALAELLGRLAKVLGETDGIACDLAAELARAILLREPS